MSPTNVTEGDTVTLRCDVKRSNPQPGTFSWLINGKHINQRMSGSEFKRKMKPGDNGSYTCEATNNEGTGTSNTVLIEVQCKFLVFIEQMIMKKGQIHKLYHQRKRNKGSFFHSDRPRNSTIESDGTVKVGGSLTLTCNTDANPAPHNYSWYRDYDQLTKSLPWTPTRNLTLTNVQRADDGCYMCKPKNHIGPGPPSDTKCITVLCKSL